jgi:hypothetical protein
MGRHPKPFTKAALTAMKCDFRYGADSGLHSDIAEGPFRANNGRRPAIFPGYYLIPSNTDRAAPEGSSHC